MNAVVYCRVSTDDQEREGTSLDTQRQACIEKARELGYTVPGDMVYSEAWTGTTTDRPKLNEVRELVRQGIISALVCYSTDRLARNPIHIAIIAEECQKRDTALVFVSEPLDNSPEGQLIRYVKGFAAQIEHEKIRERTMRGKKAGARAGKLSTGGGALFGYDRADGKRTINETQAAIVRGIFSKLAHEKYTLYRIAGELNTAGLTGPRGGRWSEHTIHRIVNNPAYMGQTFAFRYQVVEPKRPRVKHSYTKTTHVWRDRAEWIEVPNVTPPIVTPEVYQAAQRQLEINRHKSPRNRTHEYLLGGGRLRCGMCGRAMVGGAKKQGKRYYRCVSDMKPNYYQHCGQGSIKADTIEAQVWAEIKKSLEKPAVVIAELEKKRVTHTTAALEADRVVMQSEIENTRTEETRYLRQYGKGLISEPELEMEIRRVRKHRANIENRLTEIDAQLAEYAQATYDYNQFNEALRELGARLENADLETQTLALEALNVTVILQKDRTALISGTIPPRARAMSQSHEFVNQRAPKGLPFNIKV